MILPDWAEGKVAKSEAAREDEEGEEGSDCCFGAAKGMGEVEVVVVEDPTEVEEAEMETEWVGSEIDWNTIADLVAVQVEVVAVELAAAGCNDGGGDNPPGAEAAEAVVVAYNGEAAGMRPCI